jgi:hypothetical protein
VGNPGFDIVEVSHLLSDLGANNVEIYQRKAIRKVFKFQQ